MQIRFPVQCFENSWQTFCYTTTGELTAFVFVKYMYCTPELLRSLGHQCGISALLPQLLFRKETNAGCFLRLLV